MEELESQLGNISVTQETLEDGSMYYNIQEEMKKIADAEKEFKADYFKPDERFQQSLPACLGIRGSDSESEGEGEELEPFKRLESKMFKVTSDGGILKRFMRKGSGPIVPNTALVSVHYNCYQEYNEDPFDSTHLRNRSERFRLGNGTIGVIGFEKSILTMKVGEMSQFLVQPEYHFKRLGTKVEGCGPRILVDQPILYDIHLLSYVDNVSDPDVVDVLSMSDEELLKVPFSKLLKAAVSDRNVGIDLIKRKQELKREQALKRFLRALECLSRKVPESEEEKKLYLELYLELCQYVAECYLEEKPTKAKEYTTRILNQDPRNVEGLYLLAKIQRRQTEYSEAMKNLKLANQISPRCSKVNMEIIDLDKLIVSSRDKEKEMCRRMFGAKNTQDEVVEEIPRRQDSVIPKDLLNHIEKMLVEFIESESKELFLNANTYSYEEMGIIRACAESANIQTVFEEKKGAKICKLIK